MRLSGPQENASCPARTPNEASHVPRCDRDFPDEVGGVVLDVVDMVSCVRLRPAAVPARGEDPRQETAPRDTSADGLHEVSGEADGAGENHAPVRNDRSRKRRRPFSGARTTGGGVPDWLPGRVFAAVTVAPALLAVAWLVPGTGMLLAGRLLPLPMVIIFVPLAVALCYFAMRRLPARWPRFSAAEPDAARAPRRPRRAAKRRPLGGEAACRRCVLAMVVIAAGFGVWQAVLRSEQVFVTGDPGVYLQYGYWIAEHGTARIRSRRRVRRGAGAGLRDPGVLRVGRLDHAVVPARAAAGPGRRGVAGRARRGAADAGGPRRLRRAVVRRAGGAAVRGVVGGGRGAGAGGRACRRCTRRATPLSEPLVQVLLFGGLCLFTDSFVVRRLALAGLGGLALGLTVLASIGSLGRPAARLPGPRGAVRRAAAAGGAIRARPRRRHRDRAGSGARARARLPVDPVGPAAPDRAVRVRVLRGDGTGGDAGVPAVRARVRRVLRLPRALHLVQGTSGRSCRRWAAWRSGWPWSCRWSCWSGWPNGRTSRPSGGRPTRP